MNIKKLTLIATAVSALSLSPLTYARTESTDMSIIGIEPECSYFADARFNASPFSSKGDITGDKDSKFEFNKISWGGSVGVGTEITPGFEVSVVASVMTNIGTDSAASNSASSSPSSSTTPTPASSDTSAVKTLGDKHRNAYNKWLHKNSDLSKFLNSSLEKSEIDKLLANEGYSIRGAKILKPDPIDAISDAAIRVLDRQSFDLVYNNPLYDILQQETPAAQQDYAKRFAGLLGKLKSQLGNDETRKDIASLIDIKRGNSYLNDADRRSVLSDMYDAAFKDKANNSVTEADIKAILEYKYDSIENEDLLSALRRGFGAIGGIGNAAAAADTGATADIIMNGILLGQLHSNATPPGSSEEKGVEASKRTDKNAYSLATEDKKPLERAIRQAFFYGPFAKSIQTLSNMMSLTDQNTRTQLDNMITNILATQKGTKEYKDLLRQFDKMLKEENITDRTAEQILDAIIADNKEKAANAKKDQESKGQDGKPADDDADKKTASTKKPIDVNLTKFRIAVEGGVRLLEFGSGSISVIAGVGATAVTGTVAGADTGYMWGAEVYGGVKGEYAISESMAITARYTYTPALFSAPKLKDSVQEKVKNLGYTEDAVMSSLSMHELSAGIRFYF